MRNSGDDATEALLGKHREENHEITNGKDFFTNDQLTQIRTQSHFQSLRLKYFETTNTKIKYHSSKNEHIHQPSALTSERAVIFDTYLLQSPRNQPLNKKISFSMDGTNSDYFQVPHAFLRQGVLKSDRS